MNGMLVTLRFGNQGFTIVIPEEWTISRIESYLADLRSYYE
jgi:hypothetical protein